MAIYEKEFYRKGLPWRNHIAWTLWFDTDTGRMRVRITRTSKADWKNDDLSPGDFLKNGNVRARARFKQTLSSLLAGSGLKQVGTDAQPDPKTRSPLAKYQGMPFVARMAPSPKPGDEKRAVLE